MTRRSIDDWLDDILIWAERLERYLHNVDWNGFLANSMLQDAVSKCVEAIGEAAGRLDDLDRDFSERHFGVQLKQAYRARNRLSHGYFHINRAILWQTAKDSVPHLVSAARLARAPRTMEAKPNKHLDWRNVSLLGIDVGYSERMATTGIASYRFGQPLHLQCVRFSADERRIALREGPLYDAVAIDGPLLPNPAFVGLRDCERILSRGAFAGRCKAGFSHFGEGLKLRNAASVIAGENFHASKPGAPLVEAFPNAFLGVILDDAAYAEFPRPIARGTKSDLFFKRAFQDGCFDRLFDYLHWHDDALKADIRAWATPTKRIAHEYRAAIVCVLTAGCAFAGQSQPIGDPHGGFVHLPPKQLWADWAHAAISDMPT